MLHYSQWHRQLDLVWQILPSRYSSRKPKRCDSIQPIKMDKNTIIRAFSAATAKGYSVGHASRQCVFLTMARPGGQPAVWVSSPPAHMLTSFRTPVFYPQAKKPTALLQALHRAYTSAGIFSDELAMDMRVSNVARRTWCWQWQNAAQLLARKGGAAGA